MKFIYKYKDLCYETDKSNDHLEIIENNNEIRNTISIIAKKQIELISCELTINHNYYKDDLFFLNGYQSWTDSFEYHYNDKLKDANKIPKLLNKLFAFDKYGDCNFIKYNKAIFHSFDISYVKGNNPICIANLNYNNAYLIILHNKKNNQLILKSDIKNKILNNDEEFVVLDYLIDSQINKVIDTFNSNTKEIKASKMFGYTSWYNHYQNINENIILNALENQDDRFDLFQIDDGYEEYVGDWLKINKEKFPNGLKNIVDKIHAKKMKAGIWLAPFAVEEKSEIFANHKDWLKKDKNGNITKAGGNWSGFYALDLKNQEVINYINEFLNYYVELGFDFFKLDFLYAANVFEYEGMTRCEVAEYAYKLLRDILKDKLILGCGATIYNSIGKFDYLRIGPDVSLKFDDVWYMKYMHRERISTKNTIRNTIYRSFLNGKAFLNDPDVFLLRDDNISLNNKQKYALTIINSLFGSLLMTSDNPKNYDQEKKDILNQALDIFYNAKVLDYKTLNNKIEISYFINGKIEKIFYDVNKGEIFNG